MATRSTYSLRTGEKQLIVLDKFAVDGKTKIVAKALAALGYAQPDKKVLIVDGKDNTLLSRGAANLAVSKWLAPEGLNVYDIMRHQTVVFTSSSVKQVEAALKR